MKNIKLFTHGGSENHGCEAIVRATAEILSRVCNDIELFTYSKEQDLKYGLADCVGSITEYNIDFKRFSVKHFLHYFLYNFFRYEKLDYHHRNRLLFQNSSPDSVYFSIGGDNYCYGSYYKEIKYINQKLNKKFKTVLWGCSIEPKLTENPEIAEDLNRYSLIIARESITYDALKKAGIERIKLYPDPAFILNTVKLDLPSEFIPGNTVGVNISPTVQKAGGKGDIIFENYRELVKYILNNTEFNIALIPHVVWDNNNDLEPLARLFNEFRDSRRICLIGDHNCMELKGFISRCRMFIGARTHSTIAAYSSCVPTLAVGYSVKAKGIAKDIFGTYENYVIPAQAMESPENLKNAFLWLCEHENDIRAHLTGFMPDYIDKARRAGEEISALL